MKQNNFFVKLRDDKGARAIAITVAAMLLVLSASAIISGSFSPFIYFQF